MSTLKVNNIIPYTGDTVYIDAILENQTITNLSSSLNNTIKSKLNADGVISSSAQLTSSFDTRYLNTIGDNVVSSSSQLTSSFDTRYILSGSSQSSNSNFSSQITFGGVLTPPVLSASTNNYNPTGLSTCNFLRISASTNISLTGIQAPSPATNQVIFVVNVGTGNILVQRNNGGSTAANQFYNNNDVMLNTNESMIIIYDTVTGGWRTMGQHNV